MGTRSSRREWRIRAWGRDWLVVRPWELLPGETAMPVPDWLREALLTAERDPFARTEMAALFASVFGAVELERTDWHRLVDRLEAEFRTGGLALAGGEAAPPKSTSGGVAPAAAGKKDDKDTPPVPVSSSGGSKKKLTWVAVRLVTADNTPASGEKYKVTLPDGSVKEGTLNGSGEAWFENIPDGDCQIAFPEIDGREWKS